ncbi:ORF6N domain-containing protein [Candidatus Woesearchaeota archaeon]|nr:ORF6N domain-containing protein [Candidatus Woesearchaeota archaeon]
MSDNLLINKIDIRSKILTIRGVQVMLDSDLAVLYDVETKALNQAVKRNNKRFPHDFMFKLKREEKVHLVTKCDHLKHLKYSYHMPYVFTEQGVASLSGILSSKKAIEVNIQIMRAFVSMRKFLMKNTEVFSRFDAVEREQLKFQVKTDTNFEKIFAAIENKTLEKKQGIFFDGQIFDAYAFVSEIIRTAKRSIVLIDNYIDDSVLILLNKRNKDVQVIIFTKNISKQLSLDLAKYNAQYAPLEIREFKQSHDRFLIIDNVVVYHFGASLKDLGKKWFAFSKFYKEAFTLLDKLKRSSFYPSAQTS